MARIFYKAGARKRPVSGGCEEAARTAIIIVSRLLLGPRSSGERASERAHAARETISSLYLGKHIVCTQDDVSRIPEVSA